MTIPEVVVPCCKTRINHGKVDLWKQRSKNIIPQTNAFYIHKNYNLIQL